MILTSLGLVRSPLGWAFIGLLVLVMLGSLVLDRKRDDFLKASVNSSRDLYSVRTFVLQLATLEVVRSLVQGLSMHGHGATNRLMFANWFLVNALMLAVIASLSALIDVFKSRFRTKDSAWLPIVDALLIILGVFGCAYVVMVYEFADQITSPSGLSLYF